MSSEEFKYFISEYPERMPKNKVWTMTIIFAILLALFLSPHAIYPSMGALPGQFVVHDYRHDYEGDCTYVNVNCLHVSQPINIEIYKTLKRDFISYTPACINCGDGSDPSANKARFQNGLEKALGTWPMLMPLAEQLRAISGSDDELFANMVLQVVHQIEYKQTLNIQFPLITIGDTTGDCDNVATLAAAIMKAGGLDSVVVIGPVRVGNGDFDFQRHAIVGVHLSEPPNDLLTQNTNPDPSYPHYVDYHLKKYYVAEATGSRSFVGENPMSMDTENPNLVIETPDTPYMDASKTIVNNIRVNYIQ